MLECAFCMVFVERIGSNEITLECIITVTSRIQGRSQCAEHANIPSL